MSTSLKNKLTIILSLHVIIGVTLAKFCPSGRIYVSNINASFPEAVCYNGIYVLTNNTAASSTSDHPVYRHDQRPDLYVYYVTSGDATTETRARWEIGRSSGGDIPVNESDVALKSSIFERVNLDDDVTTLEAHRWYIRSSDGDQRWRAASGLVRVTCVDDQFETCTSGAVIISGMTERHRRAQGHRQGRFVLTSCTNELRPIYKHRRRNEYLFFADGAWVVGPVIGRVSGGLFVHDTAWRPEYVLTNWQVFMPFTGGFERSMALKVTCDNRQVYDDDVDDEDDNRITSTDSPTVQAATDNSDEQRRHLANAQELLQRHQVIDPAVGTVRPIRGGSNVTCLDEMAQCRQACSSCECAGKECLRVIHCGSPPALQSPMTSSIVAMSGESFLDIVFYRCSPDVTSVASLTRSASVSSHRIFTAKVCQADGTWSTLYPECPSATDSILLTPEHPDIKPRLLGPHRRRSFRNRLHV